MQLYQISMARFPITTIRPKGETNREQIYGRWPGALPDNRTTNQSEESNEPLEKTRILHKSTPHRTHPQPPPPSSSNPNAQEQARLNCSRASREASPQPRAGAEFTEKETPAPASPINTADNYTITRGNTGWRRAAGRINASLRATGIGRQGRHVGTYRRLGPAGGGGGGGGRTSGARDEVGGGKEVGRGEEKLARDTKRVAHIYHHLCFSLLSSRLLISLRLLPPVNCSSFLGPFSFLIIFCEEDR